MHLAMKTPIIAPIALFAIPSIVLTLVIGGFRANDFSFEINERDIHTQLTARDS